MIIGYRAVCFHTLSIIVGDVSIAGDKCPTPALNTTVSSASPPTACVLSVVFAGVVVSVPKCCMALYISSSLVTSIGNIVMVEFRL